jgi:hypothetical protein
VRAKVKRRQHSVHFPSPSERFGKAPPLDGLCSHLLGETEHFNRRPQKQVAKIVHREEPFFVLTGFMYRHNLVAAS